MAFNWPRSGALSSGSPFELISFEDSLQILVCRFGRSMKSHPVLATRLLLIWTSYSQASGVPLISNILCSTPTPAKTGGFTLSVTCTPKKLAIGGWFQSRLLRVPGILRRGNHVVVLWWMMQGTPLNPSKYQLLFAILTGQAENRNWGASNKWKLKIKTLDGVTGKGALLRKTKTKYHRLCESKYTINWPN